jgi:SAM-dependent methyltransferase
VRILSKANLKRSFPRLTNAATSVKWQVREWVSGRLWFEMRKTRVGIETLRNWYLDRKYGVWVGTKIPTRFASLGAHACHSADYYQLKKIFDPRKGVAIRPDDVLVDVGCGTGRVINFFLHQGCRNKIYGLELDLDIASATAQRLNKFPNVTILPGDAIENLPADGTLFFLFNPFKGWVLEKFKQRMLERFSNNGRVRIVYYHSKFIDVFQNDPNWRIEELKPSNFYRGAMLTIKPETVQPASPRT